MSFQYRKSFSLYMKESNAFTLEYHNDLNPNLWENNKLKREVRNKLIEIADAWSKFAKIPNEAIQDILIVGGNANFNYTSFSDIDLHILIDKSKIADCETILDEYLKDKKFIWSETHNIKIYGHDVEVYAQDIDEDTPPDQGVYSLLRNKWLNEPKKEIVDLDSPELSQKINSFVHKIDHLISANAEEESFEKLKEKFKSMRASGLKQSGEFSLENLTFKELRNRGYFDKINDYIRTKQDKKLSLE